MPANLSKKSVVKHRTRKPFHLVHGKKAGKGGEGGTGANSTSLGTGGSKGKGRSGFQVGPKHAPDGAYLGRAKKIKADLIEKAKIKKRFFKSINGNKGQDGEQVDEVDTNANALLDRDEGKFAPERNEEEVDDGSKILYQMRNREEVASQKEAANKRRNGKGRGERTAPQAQVAKASLRPDNAKQEEVMSKEERQKVREAKTERWHSQSGSQRGRERGQPNLGARMDLLLERIKQQN